MQNMSVKPLTSLFFPEQIRFKLKQDFWEISLLSLKIWPWIKSSHFVLDLYLCTCLATKTEIFYKKKYNEKHCWWFVFHKDMKNICESDWFDNLIFTCRLKHQLHLFTQLFFLTHDFISSVPLSFTKGLDDAKKNATFEVVYFWEIFHGHQAVAYIHATRTQNTTYPAVALHWLCNFSRVLHAIVVVRYNEQPADVSICIAHMQAVIARCCSPSLWTAAFIVELMPGKSSLMYFG